ncbi:hypothetical protein LTR53_009687 [Teratosphaeriaceae sp. CCFEE 6253]|nr:hypothetical protein LTR53_009687 [Teratosphaeriaceae sp. CCFEE 6253]
MARLRSTPTATASPPKAQAKRPALRETTNTARAKAAPAEDGNIEGLIKTTTTRRAGQLRQSAHNVDDLVMAGGLGQKEGEALRSEVGGTMTDELAKSDAPAPPNAQANRRPPRMMRKPIRKEAQSKALNGLKARMAETARKEAGKKDVSLAAKRVSAGAAPSSDVLTAAPVTVRKPALVAQELSEYDIEPSPPPTDRWSSARKRSSLAQQTSSLKPRSTPAMDTSVLKNFKRRARQPSMLAMVQQRTMSARPSFVNATAAEEDPSIFDFEGGEGEDEDDFAPEAEGTPLKIAKSRQRSAGSSGKKAVAKAATVELVSASKKRKLKDADLSSGSVENLRAKRRKSEHPQQEPSDIEDEPEDGPQVLEAQVLEAQVLEAVAVVIRSSLTPARQPTTITHDTSDVQVINSSRPTPPPAASLDAETLDDDFAVPSTEEYRDKEPRDRNDDLPLDSLDDAPNGTMAEPASSSPVPEDLLSSTQADPFTQLSPPPIKEKPPKTKSKPISTATLQHLLPKRRQPLKPRHRKSEYDFLSGSDGEGEPDATHLEHDEDEPAGRRRRQTKTTPAKGRRKMAAATSKAAKAKAARDTRISAVAPPARKSVRTYGGAAATSDKENADTEAADALGQEDDSTGLIAEEAAVPTRSRELEEARRKFAEVDEWDMEFESLGDEEHRSSSQQWR